MKPEIQTALSGGRYKLLSELGQGGMATVFHAYDSVLDVDRAVKVLSDTLAASRKVRERFVNEARTMARLQHRHIVSVFDVATDGEYVFMVMELVTGGSLVDRVKRGGPLPARMAAEAMLDVLEGLAVAHEAGVVHRDIKPHNILLAREGLAKLTDFGIARVKKGDSSKTKTGAVLGTWAYMAPEQRKSSNKADKRSDIYAVGATLYSLVTGAEPFDLYSSELHAELFEDVDPVLSRIIQKATRYKPDDRYQGAAEMAAAIREDLDRLPEVSVSVAPLVDLKALTDAFSRDDTAPRPIEEVVSSGHEAPTDVTFQFESGVSKVPPEVSEMLGESLGDEAASTSDVLPAPLTTTAAATADKPPERRGNIGATILALGMVLTGLLLVVAASIVAFTVIYRPSPATTDVNLAWPAVAVVEPETPEPETPEPEAALPPPPPRPVAVVGQLLVNALPGGSVQIEGRDEGQTPWKGELEPGKYRVRLENGGAEVERVITVHASGTAAFCWDFDLEAPC